ncbi:MAG TPA: hypothetical protein ENH46_05545 [Candidatus Pacearchaeota archaeon]|nr:hypothetical protein [Candidatus Pacearchaeota archaeon]
MEKKNIEDTEEFFKNSKTYNKVLEHRMNCDKWGKDFCLDCFGMGLTKFSRDLEKEFDAYLDKLNSQTK